MAVRTSRSARRNSASRVRCAVTFASGITADARIKMIVETTSSSTNVYPRELPFTTTTSIESQIPNPDTLLHVHRDRRKAQTHRCATRSCCDAAHRQRDAAGRDGIEQDRKSVV